MKRAVLVVSLGEKDWQTVAFRKRNHKSEYLTNHCIWQEWTCPWGMQTESELFDRPCLQKVWYMAKNIIELSIKESQLLTGVWFEN